MGESDGGDGARYSVAAAVRKRDAESGGGQSAELFAVGLRAGHSRLHRLAGLPRQRGCGQVARALREAELEAFFEAIRRSEDELQRRDEVLFAVYASTGLRRTEAVGLRWQDLDTEQGHLRVLSRKTGRSRVLKLGPRIVALVTKNRLRCMRRPEDAVFSGRSNAGAFGVRQVNEGFQHWSRKAGLGDGGVTPMRPRVSFATMLYEESGDVALVAQPWASGRADYAALCGSAGGYGRGRRTTDGAIGSGVVADGGNGIIPQ